MLGALGLRMWMAQLGNLLGRVETSSGHSRRLANLAA